MAPKKIGSGWKPKFWSMENGMKFGTILPAQKSRRTFHVFGSQIKQKGIGNRPLSDGDKPMKILTPLQHKVLEIFFDVPDLKRHFHLTGGTALAAFYLQHRLSIDLDFFTHSIAIHEVEKLIEDTFKSKGLALEKERSSPTYRRYRIDGELQVDVVRDADFRIGAP